jgi:hypothetical protein
MPVCSFCPVFGDSNHTEGHEIVTVAGMPSLTARVHRAALGAATTVLSLFALTLLTACGADEIAERATEKALERAAEGSADVDLDDDGGIKIKTEDGELAVGQGLPEDFPTGEVPLPEGEVVSGMSMAGQGWTVSIAVDGAPDQVASQVRSLLVAGGYQIEASTEAGATTILTATDDTYALTVSVTEDNGDTNVGYTVAIQQR